jgi:hypothetical protein
MDTQLRLLEGDGRDPGEAPDWRLDDDTRRIGLRGVALARQALRAAHRPLPTDADEPASDEPVGSRRHHPAA